MKKILYILLISLAFTLSGCHLHGDAIGEEFTKNLETKLTEEVASLSVAVYSFLSENERWPTSSAELQRFVSSETNLNCSAIDWDALNIEALEDESIIIEYAVPGFSMKGTLQKPVKGEYNAQK